MLIRRRCSEINSYQIVTKIVKIDHFGAIFRRNKKPRNHCGYGVFALEPIARLELATC